MTDTKAPEYSPEQVAENAKALRSAVAALSEIAAIADKFGECHVADLQSRHIRTILSALAKADDARAEWERTANAFASDVVGYVEEIALLRVRLESAERAIPLEDWHEEDGNVLWWHFPICEPPFCGGLYDGGVITEWHTHFTRIIQPHSPTPTQGGTNG